MTLYWTRGYEGLENKLAALGGNIVLYDEKADGIVPTSSVEAWEQIQPR